MNGVLQGNCRNTCNIPQKTPMEEFTKNNSLTRQMLFQNVCTLQQLLIIREIFVEVQ